MKLFLAVFALVAISHAVALTQKFLMEWRTFMHKQGKKYSCAAEEELRMKIYMENKQKIAEHNARYHRGECSYTMAMNHFGDLRHREFMMLCGYNTTIVQQMGKHGIPYVRRPRAKVPSSVDWRKTRAVSEVKDQGTCGSCWAFSATGAIEGQYYRAKCKSVSLSEQNLIDCSTRYGNSACDGGVMQYAFEYVIDNRGIDSEKSYPYEGKAGRCRYSRYNSAAKIFNYVDIQSGNEAQLAEAVGTMGPVAAGMDSSLQSFQFYNGGLYYDPLCSSTDLNHGVLVVGYGKMYGQDSWILKNSWGTAWGENGFFYVKRNKKNHCGLATQATYPIV